MEGTGEGSGGGQAEVRTPEESLERTEVEQPQVPAKAPQPGLPNGSPSPERAGGEASGAELQEPSEEKPQPPALPGSPRAPPLSLGYGAFRRLGSCSRELPPPSPSWAEQPRDGEAELQPWAASGEPGPWAPVELQVDVRVKPVGAPGASRAPSPAPSTRFLTVPVPESPAFARRSAPASQRLPRAPSPGSTWGRGSPLAATERVGPAEACTVSPGSPACRCRCRCQEPGLTKEDTALLQRAGMDSKKLPRAIRLIGLSLYMKSLRWALVVMAVLLAVCTVAIVALAFRGGARCQPCPQGWMWFQEHCYYLSEEAQDWEGSRAICSAHHATLPLLSHTQDFLRKYQVTKGFWVGALRGPEGWHWTNGVPLPSQLFPEDSEDHPDFSCGGLEEGRLVALNCSSPRPWVCARGTK
ncbi:killer cell lectin-like receptor subfamily G member 2 [Meriones unguiculatus]|uniref:killer cell lectin-like receptor subfamily G member 2 n=1 Tax=Meriones unguiculatus TaxID=10047 RepID=UPI000B4F3ACC|nr:killer cell lectin-like receptor subfamily G member 2 [Meriones unguiculatus]